MAQFKVPSQPKMYQTRYARFRGVDFSTDPALVDPSRSPFAPNLVSDAGGMPEKRPGWRNLAQRSISVWTTSCRSGGSSNGRWPGSLTL